MIDTPKANRLHISFFGRRNVGKSSLFNSIVNQNISLISKTPGTTTDPVYKSMELLPVGPVVFIDTAGFDDKGSLGNLRIKKTEEVINKTDLAIIVLSSENDNTDLEIEWYQKFKNNNIPVIGIINKFNNFTSDKSIYEKQLPIPFINITSINKENLLLMKDFIIKHCPVDFEERPLISDILPKNPFVLLVTPQDLSAPKGRLILPQVQVLRDLLDNNATVLTVKESELEDSLNILNKTPDLVITDSQVFNYVNEIIPKNIPLTSFSIIMARNKGDLSLLINGAKKMETLKPGDKILIAEACTHHSQKGDIAREKLPQWIREKFPDIIIHNIQGQDFPSNLSEYELVIHCGSCMINQKQFMNRLNKCKISKVPITNFGICISYLNGILDRVIEPFNN